MLTQQQLKEHFEYRDGHLWWIKKSARCIKIGQQFGSYHDKGYRQGWFKGKMYKEHRLIWFYHKGEWPNDQLDHKNTDREGNEIDNLRECNNSQNQRNRKITVASSKYKGVSFNKQLQKYVAYASLNKKRYHLGTFECEIAAAKAYDEFANRNFGNYKRINFG